jgi:hypothetical protein
LGNPQIQPENKPPSKPKKSGVWPLMSVTYINDLKLCGVPIFDIITIGGHLNNATNPNYKFFNTSINSGSLCNGN